MSDVQVSTTSQQAISLFISIGIPALVLLLFALLGTVGLTEFAARVRAVPSKLRAYVDEPSDPAIMLLDLLADKISKSDVDPLVIIQAIGAALDAVEKSPASSTVTTVTKTTVDTAPVDSPATAGWQAVGVVDVPNRADPAIVGMAYVAPPQQEIISDWSERDIPRHELPPAENVTVNISQEAPKA